METHPGLTNFNMLVRSHPLQTQVLRMLQTPDSVDFKAAQVDWLLTQGLSQLVNTLIPGLGRTLFQHCVEVLTDQELVIIEKMLEHADLNQKDARGLSVFDLLVPVQWGKQRIFMRLLDEVDDPVRTCIILRSAISAGSYHEAAFLERLRLAIWESQRKSVGLYEQL